jgi:hypothetical protein
MGAFAAIRASKQAAIKADINALERALMAYKEKNGDYPPSFMQLDSANSIQRTASREAFLRHLRKIRPRCNADNELTVLRNAMGPVNFTPAQALVFWLTSLSEDPARPLSALTEDRQSLLDLDKGRLSQGGWTLVAGSPPTLRYVPQTYAPSATANAPYMYFEARCYRAHTEFPHIVAGSAVCQPYLWSDAYDTNPKNGLLEEVEWDRSPANDGDMTVAEFQKISVNPSSFQILSAGLDGEYGEASTQRIPCTRDGRSGTDLLVKSYPIGLGYKDEDNDNITNFTKSSTLGDDKPE